jgi:hypothetical protein
VNAVIVDDAADVLAFRSGALSSIVGASASTVVALVGVGSIAALASITAAAATAAERQ